MNLESLKQTHDACVRKLDPSKNCDTCRHDNKDRQNKNAPCDECYDEMLFFPVNPTKWEAR